MDKIKTIKVKNEDGSLSEETYAISADAINIDMENGRDLQETIGTIDVYNKGNIAEQLTAIETNLKEKVYCFDTVAKMKTANLVKGDYASTLGYYSINDGGKGLYKIVNQVNTEDFQESLNNGLYATLVLDETIKIKQLGIFPGCNKDIASLLEKAINTELFVENDTSNEKYYIAVPIETTGNIKLRNLHLACGFANNTSMLKFTNSHDGIDIILENCIFDGNSVAIGVNGRTYPQVNNFEIKNVEIKNMSSQNYMSGTFPTAWAISLKGINVLAENCYVHDNQGHGLMVFSKANETNNNGIYNIINCRAENNGLNRYQALGIGSYSGVNNAKIFISDCYACGNGASGIAPHGINNVIIENCIANNNREHGLVVQQSHDSIVNNCIALNNASFGIRVQGDFAISAEANRFVDNVIISNNKIIGNGIKVGVKATNVVCKNNTIQVTSTQRPFYTDNGSTSRNNNSKNVSFIDNVVIGEHWYPEYFRDYFDEFVIANNTNEKGKMLPDGFLVSSRYDNTAKIFINTYELYNQLSPSNTIPDGDISTYNGTIVNNNNTFTIANSVAASSYLFEEKFPLNGHNSMTINIEFPNGTVPSIRYRDGSAALMADSIIIQSSENNGYLNRATITWTGDLTNSDTQSIQYICIALRTVGFEALSAGTYDYKIYAAYGLKINR